MAYNITKNINITNRLPIMDKNAYLLSIILSIIVLFSSACGRETQGQKKIATVNGAPILQKDFQKEIALISKRNPTFKITPRTMEDHLNTMIDRKLLIKEAIKKGLPEEERFVETIKIFWEQTLIRELIGKKTEEWSKRLFVTEEEIQERYEDMHYKLTVKVADADNKESAGEIMDQMLKERRHDGGDTIGPLFLEDVQITDPLYYAFKLSPGEARVFQSDKGYVVIQVIKKDIISIPPLEEMQNQIKSELLEQKKQSALKEWLQDIRRSASIKIDHKLLHKVANEQ
jgi:hypothetical protein